MAGEAGDPKARIWGNKASAIEARLRALDPELADLVLEVAYERVFARPGLELKTKELLAVAHLISVGSESELRTHLHGALNCGASPLEIRETILHAAMFVGFPKALAAMNIWVEVRRARSENGDVSAEP